MRETYFNHPLGGIIDLPLLVPSYSSKGFDYVTEKGHHYSQTTFALQDFARFQEESYLISTFDLHHKHFQEPERFYHNTALIFLDSGGYELNPEFDSCEPKLTPIREGLDFSHDDYINTLASLYKEHNDCPFVIANFDWATKNLPFRDQIDDAYLIFKEHPNWASNFIIKPHKPKGKRVDIDDLIPVIDELRKFNIIGITEKELGKNLMERLGKLAKLRLELNKRNIKAPIHVWGGLDPMITPLYFFAGADIFDGVSWLRYAFHDGVAVNRECYSILTGNPTLPKDQSILMALSTNLTVLQGLTTSLRAFASSDTPNFDMFDSKGSLLKKAFRAMYTKIPEIKELHNGR